jgi:uroporphyrinogen decarboxylase
MKYAYLTRDQVKAAIDGKADRIRTPMLLHFWVHPNEFGDREPAVQDILSRYPHDIERIQLNTPDMFEGRAGNPEYRWMNIDDPYKGKSIAMDEKIAMKDWADLDAVLAKWPNPFYAGMFPVGLNSKDKYRLGVCWNCLFEKHWQFRGMTNALMDPYTDPGNVHTLYDALTEFYLVMIERAAKEHQLDGIFFSDDIGMQKNPFFSIETFREFFKPYYKRLIDKAHSHGMHFWLHTCGNIEMFMPEFIEIGLDVIHPIQKYTMDEKTIAQKYGRDICIWAGFDVQRVIPWGLPEDVRKEVRFMLDTYYRPEGRLLLGAGNGVNGDCPLKSLEALFDEAFMYSAKPGRTE